MDSACLCQRQTGEKWQKRQEKKSGETCRGLGKRIKHQVSRREPTMELYNLSKVRFKAGEKRQKE